MEEVKEEKEESVRIMPLDAGYATSHHIKYIPSHDVPALIVASH